MKFQIGNAYSLTEKKGLFLSVYVDDLKLAGKKQNINPTWEVLMKDVDLEEPTSFLDHVYLGFSQRELSNTQRYCRQLQTCVWNPKSLLELQKSYPVQEDLTQIYLHGLVLWKVMPRNVWSDLANWRTKELNNYTKPQHHALTTTNSRKKKWDLCLSNCLEMSVFGAQ